MNGGRLCSRSSRGGCGGSGGGGGGVGVAVAVVVHISPQHKALKLFVSSCTCAVIVARKDSAWRKQLGPAADV